MSQTRRLAAILAADVARYSRLMGADEEGTLERLIALRRELVDPKIAEHRGRILGSSRATTSRATPSTSPRGLKPCPMPGRVRLQYGRAVRRSRMNGSCALLLR
jgi:hypothetical protein